MEISCGQGLAVPELYEQREACAGRTGTGSADCSWR